MEISEYLEELASGIREEGVDNTARRIGAYPRTVENFCKHPASAPPYLISRIAAVLAPGPTTGCPRTERSEPPRSFRPGRSEAVTGRRSRR